jgi:hypothetical protein
VAVLQVVLCDSPPSLCRTRAGAFASVEPTATILHRWLFTGSRRFLAPQRGAFMKSPDGFPFFNQPFPLTSIAPYWVRDLRLCQPQPLHLRLDFELIPARSSLAALPPRQQWLGRPPAHERARR